MKYKLTCFTVPDDEVPEIVTQLFEQATQREQDHGWGIADVQIVPHDMVDWVYLLFEREDYLDEEARGEI